MVKRALVWYNHLSYRHGLSFDSLAEHITGLESDEAGSLKQLPVEASQGHGFNQMSWCCAQGTLIELYCQSEPRWRKADTFS